MLATYLTLYVLDLDFRGEVGMLQERVEGQSECRELPPFRPKYARPRMVTDPSLKDLQQCPKRIWNVRNDEPSLPSARHPLLQAVYAKRLLIARAQEASLQVVPLEQIESALKISWRRALHTEHRRHEDT